VLRICLTRNWPAIPRTATDIASSDTGLKQICKKGNPMGKYLIAWLLGVPAFLLLLFFVFF